MIVILLQITLCELDGITEYRQVIAESTCSMNRAALHLSNKRIRVDLAQIGDEGGLLSNASRIDFDNITFEVFGSTPQLESFNLISAEVSQSALKDVSIFFNDAVINAGEIHLFEQTFFGTVSNLIVYGTASLNCTVHSTVFHKFFGNATSFMSRLEAESTCAYQVFANDFERSELSEIALYDELNLVGVPSYELINVRENLVEIDVFHNSMTIKSSENAELEPTSLELLEVTNYIDSFNGQNARFEVPSFELGNLGELVAQSLDSIGDRPFFMLNENIYYKKAPSVVAVEIGQTLGAGECNLCISAGSCTEQRQTESFWDNFQSTSVTRVVCSCLNAYTGLLCNVAPAKAAGAASAGLIAGICVLAVLVVGLAITVVVLLLQRKRTSSGPTEVIDLSATAESRPQSGKRAPKMGKSEIAKPNTPRTTSAQEIFQYESSSISPARFDSSVDGPRSISVIKQPRAESNMSPASFNAVRKAASRSGIEKLQSEEDDASYMEEGPVVDLDKM